MERLFDLCQKIIIDFDKNKIEMCSSLRVYSVLKWVEVKIDIIIEALDLDLGVLDILQHSEVHFCFLSI